MDELLFTRLAKRLVADYVNDISEEQSSIDPSEIYIVWSCKTLQNSKALLSTDIPDGRYYEVTYNGDKQEFYLDAYTKESNNMIKLGELVEPKDIAEPKPCCPKGPKGPEFMRDPIHEIGQKHKIGQRHG